MNTVVANVRQEADYLRTVPQDELFQYLFLMLFAGVTCVKHKGFREEREWRAVYNPRIFPAELMEESVEIIAGVPQHVHRIPLDKMVSPELSDLDLSQLVDRVIIGPSPYPWVLYRAFSEALAAVGVPNAEDRVQVSGIPLRP